MLNAEQMGIVVDIQLHRINGEELLACEAVVFDGGGSAVDTVLRRAAVSGRVEVEGELKNRFADLHDRDGNLVCSVALDRNSYHALKYQWARCKLLKD
jgi:hypothetical protein